MVPGTLQVPDKDSYGRQREMERDREKTCLRSQ